MRFGGSNEMIRMSFEKDGKVVDVGVDDVIYSMVETSDDEVADIAMKVPIKNFILEEKIGDSVVVRRKRGRSLYYFIIEMLYRGYREVKGEKNRYNSV